MGEGRVQSCDNLIILNNVMIYKRKKEKKQQQQQQIMSMYVCVRIPLSINQSVNQSSTH